MLIITAYTDGSCVGNPGVGGYSAIMQCNGKEKIVKGYSTLKTTNNRMELQAVISAIDLLNRIQKDPCEIVFHTDSQYILQCASHKSRNWLIDQKRPNHDLWMELIAKRKKGGHIIKFVKVQAHSGDELNERADKIAKERAKIAKMQIIGG